MSICDGLRSGDHCCWVNGRECDFLIRVDGQPRCSLLLRFLPESGSVAEAWDKVHRSKEYRESAAHSYFVRNMPGYGCGDFPQNIPEAMAIPGGRCCYGDVDAADCR